MSIPCGLTNIPSVDNSNLPCEEFINEDCVIIAEAIPFIGSTDNETLKDVILKLVERMKIQSVAVQALKTEVYNLNNN